MPKVTAAFIIVFGALLALSACNFPNSQGAQETPSPRLMVSVRTATEVRSGPGPAHDVIGALNPGLEVEALGISPEGDYLMIRDPALPFGLGWIRYNPSTVTGNPVGLPVFTSPPTPTAPPPSGSGCPTPVGGGPTPVSCPTDVAPPSGSGCPTPVGGGPTPVSCDEPPSGGCPTPVGGGPTPVYCGPAAPPSGGCPTPVGGGPTPVYCGPVAPPPSGSGCPTPIGGGPTPVSCSPFAPPPSGSGCPTPIGGGPTPVSCGPTPIPLY